MTKISSNFYFSNANYLSLYNLFLFKKFLPALISHLSLNEHLNLFPSFISILIILSDLKLIYKIFYSFILTISQLSYINNITSGSQLFYLLPSLAFLFAHCRQTSYLFAPQSLSTKFVFYYTINCHTYTITDLQKNRQCGHPF